jgi:hypothetical protein
VCLITCVVLCRQFETVLLTRSAWFRLSARSDARGPLAPHRPMTCLSIPQLEHAQPATFPALCTLSPAWISRPGWCPARVAAKRDYPRTVLLVLRSGLSGADPPAVSWFVVYLGHPSRAWSGSSPCTLGKPLLTPAPGGGVAVAAPRAGRARGLWLLTVRVCAL